MYDPKDSSFDFRKMRATDMPGNKKVSLPQPTNSTEELRMQILKRDLVKTTEEYTKTQRNKWKNLNEVEKNGLRSLLERKKNSEIVTNVTDKSGRFSVDSVENYISLNNTHVEKDKVIDENEYKDSVKKMNAHAVCWCKMLRMGSETGQEKRIRVNFHNEDPPIAGHRTLRKDHKTDFDPVKGPPGRPLCSADSSYNYNMSHFISSILKEMISEEVTICQNTEEMLAAFQELNQSGGPDSNTVILSADVKALYPSLDVDFTTDIVCEMFQNSRISIKGIDYEELGLYLRLNKTVEEIEELGLRDYCPTRKSTRGPNPNITGCGSKIKKEDRFHCWNKPTKKITEEDEAVQKKMITEALRIIIKFIMKNHIYQFDNKIRKQENGGAIGVELTGELAKIFMVWWTKQFQKKSNDEGIRINLYKIYVDDINLMTNIPRNVDIRGGTPEVKERNTAELVKRTGDTIHRSIILETDCPSNHPDKKLPILDLKVWIQEANRKRKIMHEFYQKDVSSVATINARSTLPWKTKRTILVQDTLRIMRNCHKDLPWEETSKHLSRMMMRLQYSGYDKKFRYDVVSTAIAAYRRIKEMDENGDIPMYRPKEWRRDERRKMKEAKKKNWYKRGGYESVIFVPCTPNSELIRKMKERVEESGIKIKLIEKAGRSLGGLLRTADPNKEKRCNRLDCPVCTTGGKGNCRALNVNYRMTCECGDEYNGTTTVGAYKRGNEHIDEMIGKDEDSDFWNHCRTKHGGEMKKLKMDVTETFKGDPTLRQISEAVRIERTDPNRIINRRKEYKPTTTS